MIYIYQYISHIIGYNLIYQHHRMKIHHKGITYMIIVMLGSSYGITSMNNRLGPGISRARGEIKNWAFNVVTKIKNHNKLL
jgi:hypothetical protein